MIHEDIPTLDEEPKYIRKDRETKENVAPKDGEYGENDKEWIAEFLKKQEMLSKKVTN